MKFYTAESTAVLISLIGLLTLVIAGFDYLITAFIALGTILAVIYLTWVRGSITEEPESTLIGLLPGHYLLFLGLVMEGAARLYSIPWLVLILATIGYDGVASYWPHGTEGKLTKIALYCIIWGVILFLLQGLLIGGLDLGESGKMIVRIGLSVAGAIWVAIGAVRINSGFSQRRS